MKTLLIIGAGPGGYECAVRAAKAGLSVHIVDHATHLGGTCLNEGCIPTKCLCHTAEVIETTQRAVEYGLHTSIDTFDFHAAIRRKDRIVEQLRHGIATLLHTPGITFHDGTAKFVPGNAHKIEVGGNIIEADYIIIATGSKPQIPPIPGTQEPGVVTSTELLKSTELPKRICIIGGGVIGLEFASIFNSLGTQVSVVELCKEILPDFDQDIAKRLHGILKRKGISFFTNALVTAIHTDDEHDGEIHVSYEQHSAIHEIHTDRVLMAVGRTARIDSLNLAEAGIHYTKRGIETDENMQTNIPGVYAVGDINGRCQLAHAATSQSFRALAHILGEQDHTHKDIIPATVFTSPEAAMVGITEKQAETMQLDYMVHKAFYRANGRAVSMDAGGDGLVKLITTPDEKLLGAHIIGANASELIHEVATIMTYNGSLKDLRHTIHAHPTLSELLQQAAFN